MTASLIVRTNPIEAGRVSQLFEAGRIGSAGGFQYDVAPDGQRPLLVNDVGEGVLDTAYTLVVNAPALLRR